MFVKEGEREGEREGGRERERERERENSIQNFVYSSRHNAIIIPLKQLCDIEMLKEKISVVVSTFGDLTLFHSF